LPDSGALIRRVHLVRHGAPAVDRARPPHEWRLDPAGLPAITELAASGRIPERARWFSSPEPKALGTAMQITDTTVTVVSDLREHQRDSTQWYDDLEEFRALVRRAFDVPDDSAHPGWEPLIVTRDRVVPAVRRILAEHPREEIVLVGHGTAWTLVAAELTDRPPDLDAWAALRMPDVWAFEVRD